MLRKSFGAIACVGLAFCLSHGVRANPCNGPADLVNDRPQGFDEDSIEELFDAFAEAFDAECYGADRSSLDYVANVEAQLKPADDGMGDRERLLHDVAALERAVAIMRTEISSNTQGNLRDVFLTVLADYDRALDKARASGTLPAELGQKDSFTVDGGQLDFAYERQGESYPLLLQENVFNACTDDVFDQSRCASAVALANDAMPVFMTLGRINDYVVDKEFEKLLGEVSLLDARWDAYFNRARVQNVVETGVNNFFGASRLRTQTGFPEVPESQWVVLHPGVALEYIDGAAGDDQFAQTLVVELAGRDMWTFGENSAQMKNYWGVSIIGSYSNRGSVDELGYGLMAHWNRRFAIGATLRDDDVSVLLSVDLQDLLLNWTAQRKRKLLTFRNVASFRDDVKRCLTASGNGCQLTQVD